MTFPNDLSEQNLYRLIQARPYIKFADIWVARPRAIIVSNHSSVMCSLPKGTFATETVSQRTTGFSTKLSVTNGKLSANQPSIPPSSGRTLVIPLARSSSATRALVASLGHEQ